MVVFVTHLFEYVQKKGKTTIKKLDLPLFYVILQNFRIFQTSKPWNLTSSKPRSHDTSNLENSKPPTLKTSMYIRVMHANRAAGWCEAYMICHGSWLSGGFWCRRQLRFHLFRRPSFGAILGAKTCKSQLKFHAKFDMEQLVKMCHEISCSWLTLHWKSCEFHMISSIR